MNTSTPVEFTDSSKKIDYKSNLVLLGSCFSENIGNWISDCKFNTLINPFGITYNPISISRQLQFAINGRELNQKHLVNSFNRIVHLDIHKKKENLSEDYSTWLGDLSAELDHKLKQSSHLFLTFGTSYAFKYIRTGEIINNCHKLPGEEFEKVLLSEEEMFESLSRSLEDLINLNPDISIYLSVSPIRHTRNGAIGNQRSKARLLRLCEMLETRYEQVNYIPIYEFVMDELRDYRYYRSDDFIHLNQLGLSLIKEKFKLHFIDESVHPILKKVEKLNKMKSHKILNPDSIGSKEFELKIRKSEQEVDEMIIKSRS